VELIFTYLKRPYYIRNGIINWSIFFKAWILTILFTLPLGPIIEILKKIASIKETDFNYSPLIVFLSMVLLAPIIEELIFRLILKPRYINCVIFTLVNGLLAIIFLYKKVFFMFIPVSLISLISLYFLLNKKGFKNLQTFFLGHFKLFFYLSSFLFGFLHVTNYEPFNYKLIIVMPILISPIVVTGILLGFIRMKFGIIYSILLHSLINLVGFVSIIISK
jgi:uncharacterized protein